MKMLSKENLIARTSDIGFCLGLLVGKIWVVGFVIASAYGSSVVDRDIDSKTGLGLKQYAQQLKNTAGQLQKRTEELQEQLSKQPAPKTPVRIKKRRETLTDAVSNPQSGVLATPLTGMDTDSIVEELKGVELTGDDVRDFRMLCDLFEVHIKRRTPTPNSVTALAITDGGAAAGAPMALVKMGSEKKPCDEPTDLNDIFDLFKRRLAGVIGPDFLAFYTKEFDVLVVAKSAGSPMKHAMPAIDLNAIGQDYVDSIAKVLDECGALHTIVTTHRDFSSHELLIGILRAKMQQAAKAFRPSTTKNLIQTANELRDRFYETATLAFFTYISGNSNQATQSEIIALSRTDRRGDISGESFVVIQKELYKVFYPESLPSFVMTKIEFGGTVSRKTEANDGGYLLPEIIPGRPVVATISWFVKKSSSSILSCFAPAFTQSQLENGSVVAEEL